MGFFTRGKKVPAEVEKSEEFLSKDEVMERISKDLKTKSTQDLLMDIQFLNLSVAMMIMPEHKKLIMSCFAELIKRKAKK